MRLYTYEFGINDLIESNSIIFLVCLAFLSSVSLARLMLCLKIQHVTYMCTIVWRRITNWMAVVSHPMLKAMNYIIVLNDDEKKTHLVMGITSYCRKYIKLFIPFFVIVSFHDFFRVCVCVWEHIMFFSSRLFKWCTTEVEFVDIISLSILLWARSRKKLQNFSTFGAQVAGFRHFSADKTSKLFI